MSRIQYKFTKIWVIYKEVNIVQHKSTSFSRPAARRPGIRPCKWAIIQNYLSFQLSKWSLVSFWIPLWHIFPMHFVSNVHTLSFCKNMYVDTLILSKSNITLRSSVLFFFQLFVLVDTINITFKSKCPWIQSDTFGKPLGPLHSTDTFTIHLNAPGVAWFTCTQAADLPSQWRLI